MPPHHRVGFKGRLEHVVRGWNLSKEAILITLLEDDVDSPVRGTLRVWEVPLTAKLSPAIEREDKSKNWLIHKSMI